MLRRLALLFTSLIALLCTGIAHGSQLDVEDALYGATSDIKDLMYQRAAADIEAIVGTTLLQSLLSSIDLVRRDVQNNTPIDLEVRRHLEILTQQNNVAVMTYNERAGGFYSRLPFALEVREVLLHVAESVSATCVYLGILKDIKVPECLGDFCFVSDLVRR